MIVRKKWLIIDSLVQLSSVDNPEFREERVLAALERMSDDIHTQRLLAMAFGLGLIVKKGEQNVAEADGLLTELEAALDRERWEAQRQAVIERLRAAQQAFHVLQGVSHTVMSTLRGSLTLTNERLPMFPAGSPYRARVLEDKTRYEDRIAQQAQELARAREAVSELDRQLEELNASRP